jgi:DNA mismatch endonuclease, patch repair protein
MADIFTKEKRSSVMSRIRGRGNRDTELALAKLLRANRIKGWRRHQSLYGTPDFVFRKERLVIFVDGCFWHCCPKHRTNPKTNEKFWAKKLARNRARDRSVTRDLRGQGWTVLRVWQHELSANAAARLLRKIQRTLSSSRKPSIPRGISREVH